MSNGTKKKSVEMVAHGVKPSIPGEQMIEEIDESYLDTLAGGVGNGGAEVIGEDGSCCITNNCVGLTKLTKI
ncbi:hypothetical protein EON77_08585 [bacterium]|nr:MAG: hypothetical protein EON77_08585 [bacterium]